MSKKTNNQDANATTALKSDKTVAVYSTRNMSWQGIGKVARGYNIVTEAAAERWLTRSQIRLATPEEVAGAYRT